MKDHTDRTFIFVALVVLVLLLMHLLPIVSIGDVALRPVNILSDITDSGERKDAGMWSVIPSVAPRKGMGTTRNDATNRLQSASDTDLSWPKGVEPIYDFSQGKGCGMEHFYACLDSLESRRPLGRPVRIAFYGDSFIESDMLVADLREMLQARYGGNGVGWVNAGSELTSLSPTIGNHFSGLTEHLVMRRNDYQATMAGLSEHYYLAAPQATTRFTAKTVYPHAATWQWSTLYLRSSAPATIRIQTGANTQIRPIAASEHVQAIETPVMTGDVSYTIQSGRPTLFGVAHESGEGIVIDNFSMRGSSGITLAHIPTQTLTEFSRLRPYDLIIFEYGVNAISEHPKPDDLKWYMRNMRKVIAHYQKCFPQTSLLILGAPDRGARRGNSIGTMDGIESLVEAQRQLAKSCGTGFYSLFHAMGGRGSMGKLVNQNLASKDYIHLKPKGGKEIARHIYESFVEGKRRHQSQKGLQTIK